MSEKHESSGEEEEEPTEKEGLLDLAWERQQAKVSAIIGVQYSLHHAAVQLKGVNTLLITHTL